MKLANVGAFVAALATVGFAATSVFAQGPATGTTATTPPQPQKHDSNTLHKLGNAIQYPVRKAAENASVDTHKAASHKSVVRNRTTGNNYVVKPNGSSVIKSSTNPYIRHHHSARWYRTHHRRHRTHRA